MTLEVSDEDTARRRPNGGAWGLMLSWTGTMFLAPGDFATLWHVWLVGIGVILIGAALVAQALGYHADTDTWILGTVGVVSGSAGLVGIPVSAIGLALLLFGAMFIVSIARSSPPRTA